MTAQQVAQHFHAKEIKRGRQWLARCPAHSDKHPSLQITPGTKKVTLTCWSGCQYEDIVAASGLKKTDLYYDAKISRDVCERLDRKGVLSNLERAGGLAYMLAVLEPKKRNYWMAVYRRLRKEHFPLWVDLYPVEAYRIKQANALQAKIRRLGWDGMWNEYLADRLDR